MKVKGPELVKGTGSRNPSAAAQQETGSCSRRNPLFHLSEHLQRDGQRNGVVSRTPLKAVLRVACFLLGTPPIGISEQPASEGIKE